MDKLMDYVCEELKELERKADKEGKLSAAETEYGNMLTEWKKNMLKVDKMTGENEFEGMSYRYDDGMSYEDRNRNGRSNRGSYARGRGRYAKRDDMGRYSSRYSMANDEMIEELRDLMEDAPDEQTRKEFEKFIHKMEQM
jgi:hypothetical protein